MDCDTKCETLGCGEVEQVDVGECWKDDGGSGGGGGGNGVAAKDDGKEKEEEGKGRVWDDNEIGPGELDTDTVISGAIGLPSADYVEGLADAGENY